MDNAPYHSIEINKAPTSSLLKSHMKEWLRNRNVEFDPRATKPVQYELIKLKKDSFRVYEIDRIAEMHGHTIARLPPYHFDFNAIEPIWTQVKNDVAKHNISFKSGDVKAMFDSAIRKLAPENWKRACEHVIKTEQFY
ncbi:hypothetical protein C0J52_06154 [Blattella germanica]|nr:hypothetical protein C0J52_06154 [Blattella germanica]